VEGRPSPTVLIRGIRKVIVEILLEAADRGWVANGRHLVWQCAAVLGEDLVVVPVTEGRDLLVSPWIVEHLGRRAGFTEETPRVVTEPPFRLAGFVIQPHPSPGVPRIVALPDGPPIFLPVHLNLSQLAFSKLQRERGAAAGQLKERPNCRH
jgi:hypothetical protein